MTEARITCTCTQISLPDIGLDLIRGQVEFVPEELAKASKDLARARHVKAVSVVYVQRYARQRAEPLPSMTPTAPPRPAIRPAPPPSALDPDEVAERVARRLAPGADLAAIREEVSHQLGSMRMILRQELRADLAEVLRGVGTVAVPTSQPGTVTMPEDEPVFIPSQIGEDLKGDIGVKESASEAGVDDAAAALRAARKKKRTT